MSRVDQRQALEAFSRQYVREFHTILPADLGRSPQFVFQQLYNRLQWDIAESEYAERIWKEAAHLFADELDPLFYD